MDGKPVVLLHHGLGSTRAWKAQIPALAEDGFKVLAYDRWGYGDSEPRLELGIPEFKTDLEDLGSLLVQLEIEKTSLVGHSDGGTIALYYAALQPEKVEQVVVVAAHIYVEEKMTTGIKAVKEQYERDARFRKGLERVHGEKAEQVFANWYGGWFQEQNLNWDMRQMLGQIAAPVLVVQGSEDEHASPDHAADLAAALQKGELWLEAGAAHMLPQQKPEIFNRRVLEFLRT